MPEFTPDALIEVMRGASEQLKADVGAVLTRAANAMQSDVRQRYAEPVLKRGTTGNLADHVAIHEYHPLLLQVRATARHLHLYELGTSARQYITNNGIPKSTGAARPQGPVFVSLAVSRRAEFMSAAESLLGDREL